MRDHPHPHQHRHHDRPGGGASSSEITGWTSGALPPDLYRGVPTIEVDRDEILVVGDIGAPEVPEGLDAEGTAAAERARIARFREETREQRIAVARQAEARYDRPISWGATAGATTERFTTVHARLGTRLSLEQRRVLDHLVAAGVARHRGHALAWCVDLVQQNEEAWLARLQEALDAVRQTAADAPTGPEAS
jgi:hypothetical protein